MWPSCLAVSHDEGTSPWRTAHAARSRVSAAGSMAGEAACGAFPGRTDPAPPQWKAFLRINRDRLWMFPARSCLVRHRALTAWDSTVTGPCVLVAEGSEPLTGHLATLLTASSAESGSGGHSGVARHLHGLSLTPGPLSLPVAQSFDPVPPSP